MLAIGDVDSDGDGFTNDEEIEAGTHPGNSESFPFVGECPDEFEHLLYRVCEYDPVYTFRKLRLDFCGQQPSFAEYEAFAALSMDEQIDRLDEELDACLATPFWRGRDGMLWQLAYSKVRPVAAFKSGAGASDIVELRVADYDHDLALYAYSQVDGHDARDVLLADYFVLQDGLDFIVVDEIPESSGQSCISDADCPVAETCILDDGGARVCECLGGCVEAVDPDRRQGMLTTRWMLIYFTMFTAIPRNTAAQAYRSFLGYDIAKQEGLFPGDLPADYDSKGVAAEACAVCHVTLDELTYPFTRYQGIGPNRADYHADRMSDPQFAHLQPDILDTPESGRILGIEVDDLGGWADVAANSDEFARAAVGDYWELLMGREPTAEEAPEFNALWSDFRDGHSYSVEAMLHDFIKTEAYGAP